MCKILSKALPIDSNNHFHSKGLMTKILKYQLQFIICGCDFLKFIKCTIFFENAYNDVAWRCKDIQKKKFSPKQ
jgi:hypothetical protein